LTAIPKELFRNLTFLEELNIANNQIGTIEVS
jgi:hypothetical protein